jgi:hypothetical protein
MLTDVRGAVPGVKAVVIYDQATFSSVPYYSSAVEHVKTTLSGLCAPPSAAHIEAVSPADLGTAASGLAALIGVTLPSYAINGQAITTIDTSALAGVFASVATGGSVAVINPVYLLPPRVAAGLNCGTYPASQSISALWALAATEARQLTGTAASNADPVKSALPGFRS